MNRKPAKITSESPTASSMRWWAWLKQPVAAACTCSATLVKPSQPAATATTACIRLAYGMALRPQKKHCRVCIEPASATDTLRSSATSTRLDALRQWRHATALEHGVPAYVVFHDATLEAVAAVRPRTLNDLSRISGIGAKKLERYGEALLKIACES